MRTLWLGLEAPLSKEVFHYPMIRVESLKTELAYESFTHIIFTSKTAVSLLLDAPKNLAVLAVGKKTAQQAKAFLNVITAKNECAEGVIELLKDLDPLHAKILYPHSKKSRPLIQEFLLNHGYQHQCVELYDIYFQAPLPRPVLDDYEKLVFTSPSTVDAFFNYFKELPAHLKIECIGPITSEYLTKKLNIISF